MTDERRDEAFGTAAFVLTANLLRELVVDGVVSRDRAIAMLENAIAMLRRLYHAEPRDDFDMALADRFDLDLIINAAHEEEAERLLRAILDGLHRRAP